MEPLHPIHSSVRGERTKYMPHPRPYKMDRMGVTNEQRELFESIALSIFTDMTNSGRSLQETLSAIYLSGIKHALHKEETND